MKPSPCKLFVELCAGTAAVSLRLHGGKGARPPVSRMGAKTGYANAILRVLGLRPGQGYTDGTRYLWCEPDAGVRLLLEAYRDRDLALAAAEIIRSWKDEEPRALWERLRAEGPPKGPPPDAREVARWAWVQGHGDSSKPPRLAAPYANPGGNPDGSWKAPPRDWLARRAETIPTLPATIHPDARRVDPREVARWVLLPAWSYRQGDVTSGPATPDTCHQTSAAGVAGRLDRSQALPATIHPDAREVEPPPLSREVVAYMDPPYVGTTGYADALPREDVVMLARRWDAAGATVCISEAEPIPELVKDGWHAVEITNERKGQRRTFSKQQAEWLTVNREPAWVPPVQGMMF